MVFRLISMGGKSVKNWLESRVAHIKNLKENCAEFSCVFFFFIPFWIFSERYCTLNVNCKLLVVWCRNQTTPASVTVVGKTNSVKKKDRNSKYILLYLKDQCIKLHRELVGLLSVVVIIVRVIDFKIWNSLYVYVTLIAGLKLIWNSL